ncbi:hypothetical protein QBC35DRAFT_477884 [Podospora australis]|uniref:Uncharacterized protein n=1 Tax=Podospora australis TaxID=1536484 RepID=A0AAN7ACN7_9PEZI|nr:hypothetical protein QBC35DRAFT_477884 [Podospora australis]
MVRKARGQSPVGEPSEEVLSDPVDPAELAAAIVALDRWLRSEEATSLQRLLDGNARHEAEELAAILAAEARLAALRAEEREKRERGGAPNSMSDSLVFRSVLVYVDVDTEAQRQAELEAAAKEYFAERQKAAQQGAIEEAQTFQQPTTLWMPTNPVDIFLQVNPPVPGTRSSHRKGSLHQVPYTFPPMSNTPRETNRTRLSPRNTPFTMGQPPFQSYDRARDERWEYFMRNLSPPNRPAISQQEGEIRPNFFEEQEQVRQSNEIMRANNIATRSLWVRDQRRARADAEFYTSLDRLNAYIDNINTRAGRESLHDQSEGHNNNGQQAQPDQLPQAQGGGMANSGLELEMVRLTLEYDVERANREALEDVERMIARATARPRVYRD